MPKGTTSKHGSKVHRSVRHPVVRHDGLTEEIGLNHGAVGQRRPVSGLGSEGEFDWENNHWREHHAPVRVQTMPPQPYPPYSLNPRASATRSFRKDIVTSQVRQTYKLRGDVDWGANGSSVQWECEANGTEEDAPLNSDGDENQSGSYQYNHVGYEYPGNVSAIAPQKNRFESTTDITQATTNWDMNPQRAAIVETEGKQTPKTSIRGSGSKVLPVWVHPKWTRTFLPSLTHALFISRDPFEEFRSTSPKFIATFETTLKLVYPNVKYSITENDAIAEEMARRLSAKRSKITSTVLDIVKRFFEQPQYANCPNDVKNYARWALTPGGPAFHEIPTPITCKVERDHEDYIEPEGTFQSPFISKAAKHFLSQAKGSVLDQTICASDPPKGLYALLLVSVERAFTAFKTGSFIRPKVKFSHENYHTQLETYLSHLDTVSERGWENILCKAYASDSIAGTVEEYAEAIAMSINRNNLGLYINGPEPDNVEEA